MKKELFRKGSPFTKATAAVLSLTLAFGMTPALALAQPTNEGGGTLSFETNAVTLQDGTYSLTLTSSAGMVNPDQTGDNASKIVVNGDTAYLIFSESTAKDANNYPKYDGAWLGKRSEAPSATASDVVNGIAITDDEDAVVGMTFVLPTTKAAIESALNDSSDIDAYFCVRYSNKYINSSGETDKASTWMGSDDNYFTFSNVVWQSSSTDVPSSDSDDPDATTTIEQIDADNITNTTDMFKVAAAQIETTNGKSNLRFTLSGSSYVELFMGTYEQCVANGDGTQDKGNNTWIHGVTDPITLSDGKAEFVIPLAQGSGNYAITSISNTHYQKYLAGTEKIGQCMYPRYIKVDADELTLEAGDYSATTTLTVTSSGAIPRITASTLDTVGGPASNNYSETLNLTTDAAAAYVGTAEAAATATEGVAAAADGKITICLTKNNRGGTYAANDGWSGEVALALKDANGTWVDTTTKVDKATKTLTVEGPDASLEKGQYNITASINKESNHTQFTMCKVSDAALFVTDEGMTLRFKISTNNYKGIFMGAAADATLEKTIMGTSTSDGFYMFDVPVTEDMLNTATPVTILKKDGKNFYTNNALELSLTDVAKQEGASPAAQAIIDTINTLPAAENVTLDDGATIRSARSAYDALMDFRKDEVTNYSKLVAVEEAYAKIPIVWPSLSTGYDQLNLTDDPYYRVAYNDNNTNIFVQLYVDTRNYNRAFALPATEVTAETTGGTLTAITDSDAGRINFTVKEVQLGKTYTYTLAKIVDGKLEATKEISFTIPSFRKALEADTYAMTLQSDCAALNGVAASVTSDGASMTATVTPNTTGTITKMFAGTAEAAAAATEGVITPNAQGAFEIPVAKANIPLSLAVFDGTKWSDQRIQIVANEQTQSVIQAIQNIYRDGVDDSGKALTRASYWDIYPADRDAVNAANVAYQKLSDEQKLVVGQSNASELLHAVAMFKSADSVSAEIDALPSTPAEVKTQEQVNAIHAAKIHYDNCGDNIFDWYPQGSSGASVQDNYVQKLISSEKVTKLTELYKAVLYELKLSVSESEVQLGKTVKVDIVASAPFALSCAQFKIASSDKLKLISIEQGSSLALDADPAKGSFEATIDSGMVSFYGNTANPASGIVVATATFEAMSEGDATVSVSDAVFGMSGNAPDVEDIVLPSAAKITVAYAGDFNVSKTPYVETSNMKLVTFVGTVNEGEVPTMKGTPMYKLGDSYVMLASAADATTLTRADFGITEGAAQVVSVDGDINQNGNVNIVDAQLAYDIARGVYTDFEALTQEGYLKADVNGDASVDAADALAIQYFALYGKFGA